jgi:hypothetical protein
MSEVEAPDAEEDLMCLHPPDHQHRLTEWAGGWC